MIEVLRDDNENITAVCEWLLLNDRGIIDETGTVVLICEMEVNKEHRGNGSIKQFTDQIQKKSPTANRVVFLREIKYPGRKPSVYSREQILKRLGE
jgi:hypothetical protein